MNELDANEWIALVRQDCEFPDVVECLGRHGVTITQAQWTRDAGSLALARAGVILHLRKSPGSPDAFVQGVEFAINGLHGGASYDGGLPYDIDAADTLMDISRKLHPAMPTPSTEPHSFDAVFPEHRLRVRMDEDEILQSLLWATTREL